ncbi:MAG TPA: BCCT family transporter [Pseudogracilibacillus sp.]|nr:BCCT family transporter [Pseudogracilibacillus sp.]
MKTKLNSIFSFKKLTPVFLISLALTAIFIIWGALTPDNLESVTSSIQGFLQEKFGWFYLISASAILLFVIYLAFSKFGHIKLGADDEEPEYHTISWIAMLFSAGMGIGLVFWGVAEPVSHYFVPASADPETAEAAVKSLQFTLFHWGLHPWGIYALIALALAFFQFRKGSRGLISSTFEPLIGSRIHGPIGKTIDIIAVFATVFGVATSLGLGAIQINGGLSYLNNNIPNSFNTQLMIIIGVTILFTLSALSGIGRGIKWLSNANVLVAILLMFFVLFTGPTTFLLNYFTTSIGNYLEFLPQMSFRMSPFDESGEGWIQGWTIFYWAWWIAWSPFVGTFIARISRGRTIRQFIIGVLAVPTAFSAVWFSVFGGAGIFLEMFKDVSIWGAMGEGANTEIALFATLSELPLSTISIVLSITLITTFFITSADSATFVLGMQTTNGMLNPPNRIKLTWGIIQAGAAAVLLWSGGLGALQTASIISAFPFTIILTLMMFSLHRALEQEYQLMNSSPKKRARN